MVQSFTKRVNQSARSVIGPDPTLKMGQVAVPEEIAAILTKNVVVCDFNKKIIEDLVYSGKCNFVVKKNGSRINLKYALHTRGTKLELGDVLIRQGKRINMTYKNITENEICIGDTVIRNGVELTDIKYKTRRVITLENGDTVERQLQNGDSLHLNRQPTLHSGSFVAVKAVIRPGKTIRMPLAQTKMLNAKYWR